jgi:hypothetical protein
LSFAPIPIPLPSSLLTSVFFLILNLPICVPHFLVRIVICLFMPND